jgi:lipoprotein-releasing system permease protein
MPLLAALAVALCTAMVLVVWSVMGGFLNALLAQGRGMIGDVSIAYPVHGIPHYAELVAEIEADPLVDAATATIETPAMLGLDNGEVRLIQCIGVDPERYDRVTGFYERLWWRPIDEPLPRDKAGDDLRLNPGYAKRLDEIFAEGTTLSEIDPRSGEPRPAMAMGIEVTRYNERRKEGFFDPFPGLFAPTMEYTIGVLPFSRKAVVIDVQSRMMPVANEFRSGMYEVDANWVVMPFGVLQSMLKMGEGIEVETFYPGEMDEEGNLILEPTETGVAVPARATNVLIRAADGVTADRLEARVEEIYEAFARRHEDVPISARWKELMVYRWEEKPGLRQFIAAVKKETALVLTLFAFISLTAVFLVCAIFWAMVSEKTKDIGVLRALGASRGGVAWLYLRYGLAIGLVGSAVGGVMAFLIVTNINPIHEWLGQTLGVYVWDPSVYYFTQIPNKVEPTKAAFVLAGGVVFSVLGALLPALRAAWMDPVKALRFE